MTNNNCNDDLLRQAMERCGEPAGHPTQDLGNHAAISAYGLAVAAGYRGTLREWLDSLRGEPGRPGRGFEVLGYFETLEELVAEITEPEPGDAYGVGADEEAEVYVWDAIGEEWHNIGTLRGPKGDTGEQGPQGEAGYCPSVTAKRVSIAPGHYKGVEIKTVNKGSVPGTETIEFTYVEDGQDGADGITPIISVTDIAGGHRVTISYDTPPGQTIPGRVFDVMDGVDGTDGSDGADGADGVSPAVAVAAITGGHSVTITDAEHPSGQSFNVMDGTDGTDGADGVSPTLSSSKSGKVTSVYFTDKDHSSPTLLATINDGADGAGSGDMLASVYDQDGNGVVDDAEALGGKAPSYYAAAGDVPTKVSDLTNDSGFLTSHQDISGKADKVSNPTSGNFAALDSNGNLTDSGKKAADFLTQHQDISGKQDRIKPVSVTLSSTWSGSGPYTQTVSVSGYTVTANTKVDLQPDATAIGQMISDGVLALYIVNNNGTLTAYAVGAATTASLTLQATCTEVAA